MAQVKLIISYCVTLTDLSAVISNLTILTNIYNENVKINMLRDQVLRDSSQLRRCGIYENIMKALRHRSVISAWGEHCSYTNVHLPNVASQFDDAVLEWLLLIDIVNANQPLLAYCVQFGRISLDYVSQVFVLR